MDEEQYLGGLMERSVVKNRVEGKRLVEWMKMEESK